MKLLHIYLNGDLNLAEVLMWGARSWVHRCLHTHGTGTGTPTEFPLLMIGNSGMHQIQLGQKHVQQKQRPLHNILSLRSYFANLGFCFCSFRQQHIFIPYRTILCCVYLEIAVCSCKQFKWLNKRWLWPILTCRSPKRNTKTNQSVLTHTQLCPVCSCSKSLKLCRHSF